MADNQVLSDASEYLPVIIGSCGFSIMGGNLLHGRYAEAIGLRCVHAFSHIFAEFRGDILPFVQTKTTSTRKGSAC